MRTKKSSTVREGPTFIEGARRAQIIEAAIQTVAELGFGRASLAQIARKAGISKSVIGYYFPTRDDLVRQAVDHFYVTGHESMASQMDSVTSATELLRSYIASNIAYIDTNRVAVRAIGDIVANFRAPDGQLVYRVEDTEPLIQGTQAMFAWGQETGEFRAFDTRVMAVMLRGCMDAFGQQLTSYPGLSVATYTSEVTDLFIQAARNTA